MDQDRKDIGNVKPILDTSIQHQNTNQQLINNDHEQEH